MPKIIKDKQIVDDVWTLLNDDEIPSKAQAETQQLVTLQGWQSHKELLEGRKATLGILLKSDELADSLGKDAKGLGLISIEFPTFMDGRGFSTARLLRDQYGFEGELRASGHIIRDQLFYLQRCGFTSFCFEEGTDLETTMASLNDFSETYQAAYDQSQPLFRRRATK